MNFDQTTLSPLCPEDFEAFRAIYSHPRISELIELQLSGKEIRDNFDLALAEKERANPKQLINSIRLGEGTEIVGIIGFSWDKRGAHSGELGIVLMPGKTRKGTAKTAMNSFIETLFARHGVTLIHSKHNVANKAAFFVAKSVGFEFEVRNDLLDIERAIRYGKISLSRWRDLQRIASE